MPNGRGGYRIPEYKPFFGKMMRGIAQTTMGVQDRERSERIQREKNKLSRDAWMGNPSAMAALAEADPELAMKVEDQRHQREAAERQKEMAVATERRAVAGERRAVAGEERAAGEAALAEEERFEGDMERITGQLANFPDFPSAQRYGQQQTDMMAERYPELWEEMGLPLQFDEESFNDIKTAAGPQPIPEERKTQIIEEIVDGEPQQGLYYEDGSPVLDEVGQPITFGPKPTTKKEPSGEEKGSAGFLHRMYTAQINLDNVALRFPDFNPASPVEILKGKSLLTMTDEFRLYKQAAIDWVRAKLRDESGAVIGDQEAEDEYNNYFPQAYDPPELLAQKRAARKTAEEAMLMSASRAWADPEPGKAMYNPVDATTLTEKPPKGTWIRLPSGIIKEIE